MLSEREGNKVINININVTILILYYYTYIKITRSDKIQLLIRKPNVTALDIVESFDLTCTTNYYEFGRELNNGRLYISNLTLMNNDIMQINANYQKRATVDGFRLALDNIGRIKKVLYTDSC